jgi:hypothetical protein
MDSRKTVHAEFLIGDRVRVADDAPVSLARTSDRLGTVVNARSDYARPLTVWVDSQACEFDFDSTELTLVSRPVYMTPERAEALRFAFNAAMRQLSDGCAALGKDFPDLQVWRDHVTLCEEMLAEAKR